MSQTYNEHREKYKKLKQVAFVLGERAKKIEGEIRALNSQHKAVSEGLNSLSQLQMEVNQTNRLIAEHKSKLAEI